jgi:glycerol-3-phosphate O-acyltransferase
VLVPVSIAYDQLQEVGEFAREAKGGNKSAESISWVVRAFREQRGRFGTIYVRFGEPLSLRQALGPPAAKPSDTDTDRAIDTESDGDRLALQKVALEVSRRINEVTPITATSLVTLGLLGAQGRALTIDQVRATVHDPFDYAIKRGLPLTRNVALDSNEGVLRALHELERHHVVTRYAGGPEPVFAIGSDQHLAAAFYRNTIIHFFLHGALAQAALARASADKVEDPMATFWEAALAARDLLKFEFFFEPREEFRAAIAAELAYQDPDWEMLVAAGPDGIRGLLSQARPITAHTVLRSFFEAYGVVAATLARHESDELGEPEFLSRCLALGRQYQLQQRIHSPESLSKPLFANALKLAASRDLIGPSADNEAQQRFLDEVRGLIRDLDLVELIATDRIVRLIDSEGAVS